MALTRRQFIRRTGLATAGTLFGPGVFGSPFVRQAMADTIGNRYFVVLFLDGGNDGLNTIVPYSSGALRTKYNSYRSNINLSQGVLAPFAIGNDPGTGTQLAMHPGLANLHALYQLGKVAVIQGCGYPDYSLSHDESRTIWQTADPSGSALAGTGWVGRHLAGEYGGSQVPAVCVSSRVEPDFRQTATSVLAVDRLEYFGFPYDEYTGSGDTPAKRQAFLDLSADASGNAQALRQYVGSTGNATLVSSESYPNAHPVWESERSATVQAAYDAVDRSTARDLREISKMIYAQERMPVLPNINAHFFQLSNGGYDTHSDQGAGDPDGQHYSLLAEVGDSLKVFYDDLVDMGVANRVCVMVWSEFARRIPQNDNGTDHGSQGPMFVIGGAVAGGVYGRHPNIFTLDDDENTVYSQAAGTHRSTDFRDVYGTLLKHWVNMTPANILANVLPLDVGDPADYWTVANFDMGFLP